MKCSKCDFFKSKIHYLGHLISPEGISPLPNKLDCIRHMPAPKDVKEIKQFLGLTGYYRKFVPRFADISRPLTTLMKKDRKFEWTPACQKSFELLKEHCVVNQYCSMQIPVSLTPSTQMQVSLVGQGYSLNLTPQS